MCARHIAYFILKCKPVCFLTAVNNRTLCKTGLVPFYRDQTETLRRILLRVFYVQAPGGAGIWNQVCWGTPCCPPHGEEMLSVVPAGTVPTRQGPAARIGAAVATKCWIWALSFQTICLSPEVPFLSLGVHLQSSHRALECPPPHHATSIFQHPVSAWSVFLDQVNAWMVLARKRREQVAQDEIQQVKSNRLHSKPEFPIC